MKQWASKIEDAKRLEELEAIRIELFGKKGYFAQEFQRLKELPAHEKPQVAKELNKAKEELYRLIQAKKDRLLAQAIEEQLRQERIDPSLYDPTDFKGARHPVSWTMERIVEYFLSLNYAIETGPLVEEDFYNFEALNLPKHHPARAMQDTFYFRDGKLLRTHTSPVQIRTMERQKPPIRMISPGPVFRRDYDLTHTPMFHQVEGLMVDAKGKVNFANLKWILHDFLHFMFGEVEVRFRPSFFPFTEPSAEVDISCIFCQGEGCRVCSQTGWLEVLGCGMVDPNVFEAVGYEDVSGFAFGLGVERFAMLIHKIPDLRILFEGDLRLLEQFR
ncbi:MAG: phenylalanine--tRNA ligase subunit alpha [Nitratiruptor sp.]|nr:phenylalanine--tRNA ligase subunit alpha [Nitratiruptor sp.]NPA83163.1 phenylalanine--tRNA ligase subunit alpha [Campylobacterota bacterium]